MTKLRHRDEELFYEAVMTLRTQEDCRHFFEDICTIKELQAIAQRMRVACLLDSGATIWRCRRPLEPAPPQSAG